MTSAFRIARTALAVGAAPDEIHKRRHTKGKTHPLFEPPGSTGLVLEVRIRECIVELTLVGAIHKR